jgi:H+/Cl- antiporter ClcA
MGPAKDLPNIWPTTGVTGFELDSPFKLFIMGCAKMIAISFTVAGGLRGGFIFPLMCAGCAFGRLLYFFLPPTVPVQVVVLCTAAALNVAITRTALATTLILAFLPGESSAVPSLLMASLSSLFATSYMVRHVIAVVRIEIPMHVVCISCLLFLVSFCFCSTLAFY